VFLYFTADWCLSCKVNERLAIDTDATAKAFAKAGVQVLTGDWTRADPAITAFLTAQGAAGVPLYLWYAPAPPSRSPCPRCSPRKPCPPSHARPHKTVDRPAPCGNRPRPERV
jgi:hypothetical protein